MLRHLPVLPRFGADRRQPLTWALCFAFGLLIGLLPVTTSAAAQSGHDSSLVPSPTLSPGDSIHTSAYPDRPTFDNQPCAFRTGVTATLILPDTARVTVRGVPIRPGDQLAAFSPEGRCAGVMTWTGNAAALTVWGDNHMTPETVEGMTDGERFHFRVRRVPSGEDIPTATGLDEPVSIELAGNRPYLNTTPIFVPDGIYIVRDLHVSAVPPTVAHEK